MKELKGQADIPLDDKKFRFDAKVTEPCPSCKQEITRDFEDNYLSYPDKNTPINIGLWCQECDKEFELEIKITSIEVSIQYDASKMKEL